MATTFSGTNLEKYQISNVNQLVGLRSTKNRNFRIRVLTLNSDESIVLTSVQIYDESNNAVIISMLCNVINDSQGYSAGLTNSEDLVRILVSFGFNVEFGEKIRLSIKTLNFLKSLHSIGYQYLKFTESGIYFYLSSLDEGQLGTKFNGFSDCDFSPLDVKEIYNIGHLIDKVTTK